MMKFEELGLVNYQQLHIHTNSTGEAQRLVSHYVGCIPDKSILLTLPRTSDGRLSPEGRLRAGDSISIKAATSNGLVTFSVKVLGLNSSPFPLLYLAYPRNFSFNNVRKDPRVDITLPLEMTFASGLTSRGVFSDISISGGRIKMEQAGAEVGEEVSIKSQLQVAGINRNIELSAMIRTCFDLPSGEEQGERVYGVEFTEHDELKSLILSAFINGEMAKRHTAN
jgi:c-di-GMP-binding flagellar brake protein YcgR